VSLAELRSDAWLGKAKKQVLDALNDDPGGQWNKLQLPLLGEKMLAAIDEPLAGIDAMELFAQAWGKLRESSSFPTTRYLLSRLANTVSNAISIRLPPSPLTHG
jgi:hypothetical protein